MNQIFTFVLEKQSRVLTLILLAISALLIIYLSRFNSLASRYMVYLFVAPICFVVLFNLKNDVIKASIPFFLLIFIEITLISRIPVFSIQINNINATFVSTGITLAFAIVILISRIYKYECLYLPLLYKVLWLVFFISLIVSLVLGSQLGADYLAVNINEFVTFYLEYLLFFYLGFLAFKNISDVNKFINVLIVFGGMAAIGHLFSIITGIQVGAIRGDEIVNHDLDIAGRNWRYGGFFGNSNTMCAYYVMILPACLIRIFKGKNLTTTLLATITFMLMILSLFFSGGRGGVVFAILNLFLCLFFIRIKFKHLSTFFIGLIPILAIIALLFDQFLFEYFERTIELFTKSGTNSPRWLIWPITMEIISDNPLGIGVSVYNYKLMISTYGNIFWANPHSIYLEMLTQAGVIGFVVFFTYVLKVVIDGIRSYIKSATLIEKEVISILLLIIFGFLLMGITEPIFRNQYKLNHLFGFILGVLLSINVRKQIYDNQNKEERKYQTISLIQ